jgi:hypothetical protein
MRKLVSLVLLMVPIMSGAAVAAVDKGDGLVWFNLGYAVGRTVETGNQIGGGVIGFAYERLDWDKAWSGA